MKLNIAKKNKKRYFHIIALQVSLLILLCLVTSSNVCAVTLVAPSNYTKSNLSVGSEYYLDRTYTIVSQPAGFENYTAILTRNDDKNVTDTEHIILNLPSAATVYVAYDKRAASLPSWLDGIFASTGQTINVSDTSMGFFRVYQKNYPAGPVILGGNACCGSSGAGSNYIVYIDEGAAPPPLSVDPASLTLAPGATAYATISGGTSPYSAASSNESVATATITDSTVTVIGVAEGNATITITDSASDTVTISVNVVAVLAASPENLSLDVGESGTVTVSGGFGPYSVLSGNQSVATATIAGSTVTVTGVGGGTVNVTITDSASNTVTVLADVAGGAAEESGLGDCPEPPFVTGANVEPNILLILDHSGSMGNGAGSRWDTAKTVVNSIIDDFSDVRFGLMRMDGSDYDGNDWGTASGWPYSHVGSKLVRQGGKILKPCGTPGDEIQTYITNWGEYSNKPQTWTNLAETLTSAGQYFATVIEGGSRTGKGPSGFGYYARNYAYDISGTTYPATTTDDKGNMIDTTSPIQYYCQKSFVIFITDGLANYDNDWDFVTDVIGDYDGDGDSGDCKYGAAGCSGQGTYFDDVAKYLYEHDMRSDLDEDQNIATYVIGFYVDDPLLSSAAIQGGGVYYTADNAAALTAALKAAIKDILDKVSSGTAVSTISTSSESDDYLIRAKFLPVSWKGYLEAFTLPFTEGDTPYWEAGSLLETRSDVSRNIYTCMSSQTPNKQEFVPTNSALKTYLSGEWGESESEAWDIINFLRGSSTFEGDKYRDRGGWKLGDIIYSTPISVGAPKLYYTENGYQSFKETNKNRQGMVYVGSNDGMLHAFLQSDGSEAWAFIPENIQSNLSSLTQEDCHNYFVDLSPVATDIYDGGSWKTVLLGGNRLGGDEYFCLNVTDPDYDGFSILWDIIPFSNRKSSTIPAIGKVNGGGVNKWVAIITSGYHEGTGDGKIAALNFTNGAKETIWNDGGSNVNELSTQAKGGSNPYYTLSSPIGVDSDADGYFDLIYAGDTEGSLWKFYYDYVDTIWKKVELFQTGGQAITAKPVVAFDEQGNLRIFFGTGKYLVGSDKFNSIQNTFYCLIEKPVVTEDANNDHYTSTTALDKTNDLVDITSITTEEEFLSILTEDEQTKASTYGWYFNLDAPAGAGERVLEEATIVSGVVFFTSFTPISDVCGYGGSSRLYAIDYLYGVQATTEEGESVLEGVETGERYKDLGSGLPSKPVFYYDKATKQTEMIIQTSDTTVHEETAELGDRPMGITSWRIDL